MDHDTAVDVQHQPDRSRFVAEVEGRTAFLSYERGQGSVALQHTIVPPELEGRGIAGRLAAAAVGWARTEGLDVDPQCSYVRSWLSRHG